MKKENQIRFRIAAIEKELIEGSVLADVQILRQERRILLWVLK